MWHRAPIIEARFEGDSSRLRLLIEDPDGWAYAERFEAAGFDVAVCAGPAPEGPDCARCSLVWKGACSAVSEADVILSALPVYVGLPVVEALAERARGVPTVLHVPAQRVEEYEQALPHATVLAFPTSLEEIVAAVQAAVAPVGASA